jgi:glycosyltransferase involved in cell wall biosynthesis
MRGQNIVCFAKDWSEDPTSNNHVMSLLARDNKVLWLNSIGMRTPKVSDKGDLSKIGRKLKTFMQGARTVADQLEVFTPIVLPLPHSKSAAAINRRILRASTAWLRKKLRMAGDFQLWTFLPNAVEYVGTLGESLVVYYCTDEFSQFSYLDGQKMAAMERELCQKADLVFTTSRALHAAKKIYNPETHLASHGVDYAHFAKSLENDTPVAPELQKLRGPILGFFGLIHDWIDLKLLVHLAERRPDWNVVLIGKTAVDVSCLERRRNVYLLGRQPYESLPSFCRGFSVGLIPFAINELTRHVNPIKLREYLSAGVPVVATPLPEVTRFHEWCRVGGDYDEFVAACEQAIADDDLAKRKQRSLLMKAESWEYKVLEIGRQVERVRAQKGL